MKLSHLLPAAGLALLFITPIGTRAGFAADAPTPEEFSASLRQAYTSLSAYSDHATQTFSIAFKEDGESSEMTRETESFETTLRVRGENFAMKGEEFEFHKVGSELVGLGHGGSIYFTLDPFRFDLTPLVPGQFGEGLMIEEHPILSFYVEGAPSFVLNSENFEILEHAANPDDETELVTRGNFYALPEEKEFSMMLTFQRDAETGLLRGLVIDSTKLLQMALSRMGEEAEIESQMTAYTFTEVKTDDEVDAAPIARPAKPDDYQEIDLLDDPEIAQKALIGGEAPGFSGELLSGESFDLAKMKGRVVVIDFWATWCGPCIQALPTLHEVAADFADEPVTVMGVNLDRGKAIPLIERAIEQHDITQPQLCDESGEIGDSYKITGIPCTIIVGPDGKIAHISTGFSGNLKAELTHQIKEAMSQKAEL